MDYTEFQRNMRVIYRALAGSLCMVAILGITTVFLACKVVSLQRELLHEKETRLTELEEHRQFTESVRESNRRIERDKKAIWDAISKHNPGDKK